MLGKKTPVYSGGTLHLRHITPTEIRPPEVQEILAKASEPHPVFKSIWVEIQPGPHFLEIEPLSLHLFFTMGMHCSSQSAGTSEVILIFDGHMQVF
jgi:hypothetical protein